MILVDECSALGNRDLYALVRALEATGASARLAGDPRQHTAVAALGERGGVSWPTTPATSPR